MPTSVTSTKLAEAARSCLVLLVQSLGVCHFMMDPGTDEACFRSARCAGTDIFQLLSQLSIKSLDMKLGFKSCVGLVLFPPRLLMQNSLYSVCSAIMGHCLHCLCGYHPGVSVLLLHLQKMDIQEEKQEEGQRQGQERHQHEGCHWWCQNWGKNFELSLLHKHFLPYMLI